MSLRDAAQQALEALEIAQDDCIHGEMAEPSPIFENAITALETALAEPQPEIERLKAERDALKAAAEKGTEYVLAHINQDLKTERDAAVADAERYRYLRNRKKGEVFSKYGPDAGCWIDCEDEQQHLVLLTGDDADAAIDAASGRR